jgi:3-ketosteroid 9alpha-monooxygenase subunit B
MPDPFVHELRVVDVVAETADSCSLVLEVPAEFRYAPGQFLTLRVPGADESVARCYSLSSSPHSDEAPKVTVKRVAGGRASNWICDHISAGSVVETLSPAGTFTPLMLDADFLLFAGGSGITPVISILKSVLCAGTGRVVLIYANQDERSVIFADELAQLARAHPSRLLVIHWLASVQGLPQTTQLREIARPYSDREVFLCGPEPFMAAVTDTLRQLDVPRERVHVERFVSLQGDPFRPTDNSESPAPDAEGTATVEVDLDGTVSVHEWPRNRPLLDALLDAGLDAPYSCRAGACSACACLVVDGEVKMLRNDVLEEEDLAGGYVLACQAVPLSNTVKVSYD